MSVHSLQVPHASQSEQHKRTGLATEPRSAGCKRISVAGHGLVVTKVESICRVQSKRPSSVRLSVYSRHFNTYGNVFATMHA